MKVMAVTNKKGGVGKTTTAVNGAAELAAAGFKTLYVDIDPQANGTKLISGGRLMHNITIADLLNGDIKDATQAIQQGPVDGLHYIASCNSLGRIIEMMATRTYRERILTKLIQPLNSYDWIIIDCPPDCFIGTQNALVAADYYLVPVDGGRFALDGMADLLALFDEINDTRPYQYAIVRNEYFPAAKVMNNFLESELEPFKDHLLKTRIKKSQVIEQATAMCQPIRLYKPGSTSAQEFKDLAREIKARFV